MRPFYNPSNDSPITHENDNKECLFDFSINFYGAVSKSALSSLYKKKAATPRSFLIAWGSSR